MAALPRGDLLHHGNLLKEVLHLTHFCTSYSNRSIRGAGHGINGIIIPANILHKSEFYSHTLHTFQEFDSHRVWCFPTLCLSCYVPLGWCCSNLHGECAFVHLAIVSLSQFGSYFEVEAKKFPFVSLGGQQPNQRWGELKLDIDNCVLGVICQ